MQYEMPPINLGVSVSSVIKSIETILMYMQKIIAPIIDNPLAVLTFALFFIALVVNARLER